MEYLLDTNIWLHLIRTSKFAEKLTSDWRLDAVDCDLYLSIVTVGELYVIAERNNWGVQKLAKLEAILEEVTCVPISRLDLIRKYAEIDLFSQGLHKQKAMPQGITARNMGKNDLWIAATASLLNTPLLTMDSDFDHLEGVFLSVKKVTP